MKILAASNRLMIKGLTSLCEQELLKQLSVENACPMLELAFFYNLPNLKYNTIELVAKNPNIMLTDEFRELHIKDMLREFVQYVDALVEHAMRL